MKKKLYTMMIAAMAVFTAGTTLSAQTVTNDFEDGNWLYYNNLCWGISPNNSAYYTKVTGNGFNGSDICETDNLGQTSTCNLLSPWISLNGSGQIVFDHIIPAFDGTRSLKVFLVSYPSLSEELIFTHNYTDGNVHTETLSPARTGTYRVKWQWAGTGGNSRGQLDNISIGGVYNSDPSNNCNPLPEPVVDTDNDGVPDAQDNYPADQYRAYDNHYPASDTSTLVFEDLWPSYGDYDLNDLVIGYKYKVITNAAQNVVEIFATFVLKAAGGSIQTGFGFQLPGVSSSSLISCTGYDLQPGSLYDIDANGTETGQNHLTVIVFDRSKRFLPHGNTIPGTPEDPFRRFNIHMVFMQNGTPGSGGAVSYSTLDIQNFNPFIVTGASRGKEVHLPGYPPTAKADFAYFGTGDDNSTPAANRFYQSATNLPWALDIASPFDYPIEKKPINECYNNFAPWAQSSGLQYPDWYMNKPGYRNPQNIY